jgi:hypothetical protein
MTMRVSPSERIYCFVRVIVMACHSEERSDEESRFSKQVFCHTKNEILRLRYASAQNDKHVNLDKSLTRRCYEKSH